VAVFTQLFPEVKRRQIKEALDGAYEAAMRDTARSSPTSP
jgi:hypothetical protein